MMMSSPGKSPECPDCKKSFKNSYAVTRHVNSGRCRALKAPQRRSERREEIPPEPDPIIFRQDTEMEDLLSSSSCDFAKYDLYIYYSTFKLNARRYQLSKELGIMSKSIFPTPDSFALRQDSKSFHIY